VPAVAGWADAAALAGKHHDEPIAAAWAKATAESEAWNAALEIAVDLLFDVGKYCVLGTVACAPK
jgi:hypothetical protein